MDSPAQLSPVTLAFMGDAVYSLLVREYLINTHKKTADVLHRECMAMVNAKAQASAMKTILPLLSEEEAAIYRRGRNANTAKPKSATTGEYHMSTGFEALFGFLHLSNKNDRIKELFNIIIGISPGNNKSI